MLFTKRKAVLILVPAVLIVFGLVAGISFYTSVEFDHERLAADVSAGRGMVFTDRAGRELRFLPDLKGERARWVPLVEIPDGVRNAFIAAEDERFFDHHGFDPIAVLRAFRSNIVERRIVSGASTISQQVVRLIYNDRGMNNGNGETAERRRSKRTYREKLIEIVRSVKMERSLSKEEILEQYLNRVPMGNNLVGVGTAARAYFGVPVKNLSAAEAAILASLPKAPGMLNPYG
ncbi:MAG TPA: biosynthetic peptidoglycan transglycosylase, partial [Nitrospirota bacterium]|nr:biosynthetic peptidoglycan transglycosylase [Nitrospirota bacterium]